MMGMEVVEGRAEGRAEVCMLSYAPVFMGIPTSQDAGMVLPFALLRCMSAFRRAIALGTCIPRVW